MLDLVAYSTNSSLHHRNIFVLCPEIIKNFKNRLVVILLLVQTSIRFLEQDPFFVSWSKNLLFSSAIGDFAEDSNFALCHSWRTFQIIIVCIDYKIIFFVFPMLMLLISYYFWISIQRTGEK